MILSFIQRDREKGGGETGCGTNAGSRKKERGGLLRYEMIYGICICRQLRCSDTITKNIENGSPRTRADDQLNFSPFVGVEGGEGSKAVQSHYHAIAALRWRCVRIFTFVHGSPN
jgi:hypothetical protein